MNLEIFTIQSAELFPEYEYFVNLYTICIIVYSNPHPTSKLYRSPNAIINDGNAVTSHVLKPLSPLKLVHFLHNFMNLYALRLTVPSLISDGSNLLFCTFQNLTFRVSVIHYKPKGVSQNRSSIKRLQAILL